MMSQYDPQKWNDGTINVSFLLAFHWHFLWSSAFHLLGATTSSQTHSLEDCVVCVADLLFTMLKRCTVAVPLLEKVPESGFLCFVLLSNVDCRIKSSLDTDNDDHLYCVRCWLFEKLPEKGPWSIRKRQQKAELKRKENSEISSHSKGTWGWYLAPPTHPQEVQTPPKHF